MEKILKEATVCLLVKDRKILLGFKTEKIGAYCFNGYGGGIESGESIKQAAIRELTEETGKSNLSNMFLFFWKIIKSIFKLEERFFITALLSDLQKVAIMDFHNQLTNGEFFDCRVHFFILNKWTGKAIDTDEMVCHQFFSIDDLPFGDMMLADREFFRPILLDGKKIIGKASYGPHQKYLIGPVTWEEVDSFPED